MRISVPMVGSSYMTCLNDVQLRGYQNRAESDIFISSISAGEKRGLPDAAPEHNPRQVEIMRYQRELDLAQSIARRAGEVALHFYHRHTETEEKPDLSPVTVADRESEQLICRLLTESFPEDGILGEE